MKKKLLALFLVLVMALGMFPMSAMATDYPDAEWYNFRNSENNMGITAAQTPKAAKFTQLDWTQNFGTYVGVPIIVGGHMYIAAGNDETDSYLYKLSLEDGSVVARAALARTFDKNNCNIPPAYIQEKGLIIIPMTEGVVQAFNINDMSTAWVYQDKPIAEIEGAKTNANGLGAQVQTPVLYSDGKLYVGFYASASANLVCLDAATGELQWYYPSAGGFYWTSPVAVGDHIVIGSESKNGNLLMFKKTYASKDVAAEPVSSLKLVAADGETALKNQRSALAFDEVSRRVYFTCASGYICSAAVDGVNGALSDLRVFQEPNCTASTNTPIVYGDHVYYGAGKYGGYYFIVANKDTLETVAKVALQSNPQGSFLLSTAYEAEGYLYFYTTYNAKPGGIDLVKVPTGNPAGLTREVLFDALGYEEYCIVSPVCDADGTIYYRNDSKTIFAISAAAVEVPSFKTNLSTALVKYEQNSEAAPLKVEINDIAGGNISYKWQSATDKAGPWTDIDGAAESSYIPQTATNGTTYYRCVVGNSDGVNIVYNTSLAAEILVKNLSHNATLNVAANTANKLDGAKAGSVKTADGNKIVYVDNYTDGTVKYIALGASEEGSFDKTTFKLYQGLPVGTAMPSQSNVSNSELYTKRYYRSAGFTLPFVASIEVTAEDGATKVTNYIVIDDKALGKYTVGVSGFTADTDTYFNNNAITFTEAGQKVVLTPVTATIGEGEENKTAWTWESSDPTVAIVDENGVVTSVGGGNAVITFTCGQLTASCGVSSAAAAHTIHTYVEGECSICKAKEPAAVKAYFSLTKDGAFVKAKDDSAVLHRAEISVADADCDGLLTLNDAFIAAHDIYSANGKSDFAVEESSYGLYITKLWGADYPVCGYKLNDQYATGLDIAITAEDHVTAYFYKDTTNYSDVYAYFEEAFDKVSAKTAATFTVKADANGTAVIPKGAAVTVYNADGDEVAALATAVGEDGSFSVTFPEAGEYIVEAGGTTSYIGSVWDTALNDGAGGYRDQEFTAAPVIPARMNITVVPYASAKVYATISDTHGNFVFAKGGEELYRLEVTVEDDAEDPDGQITIREMLSSIHAQHHSSGASAFAVEKTYYGDSITKLWGMDTNGSVGYCFNDVFMLNDGTEKTGTNGRQFTDKLLDTVVADGDCINVYLYQDGSNWSDVYTYFAAVTDTATVGEAKTLTVKAGEAMSGEAKIPVGAAVKVTNSAGEEQPALNTTVGENGAFSITFPAADTYTVEVRSKDAVYVTPSRCVVAVTSPAGGSGGTGGGNVGEDTTITVSFALNTHSAAWIPAHYITLNEGATVADAFRKVLDNRAGFSYEADPDYVRSITYNGTTLGEFTMGANSGWKYMVNGVAPGVGMLNMPLEDGDVLVWYYITDYTMDTDRDEGGGFGGFGGENNDNTSDDDKTEEEITITFTDVAETDFCYEAVKWAVKQGITDGTSDTTFSPTTGCTRAQMVTFLWRAAGKPNAKASAIEFTDIDKDAYYYEALCWAVEVGITDGTGANTFSPNAACTRGQMATFLYRYEKDPAVDGQHPFTDVEETDFYNNAVIWAAAQGITDGTSATTFSPDAVCTRGQMVTFLYRSMAE